MSRAQSLAVPLLVLLAGACSTVPREPGPSVATGLVARADELAANGQSSAAFALYERVLREYAGDPASADALHGLGRMQADPASGLRNYRAAHATFTRLLAEYPQSRWGAEARAWRAVLADLLAREDETVRLKSQIEHLRRTDLELERRR
jgi:hypothetical protein